MRMRWHRDRRAHLRHRAALAKRLLRRPRDNLELDDGATRYPRLSGPHAHANAVTDAASAAKRIVHGELAMDAVANDADTDTDAAERDSGDRRAPALRRVDLHRRAR